ncbi:MAG: hypothetical protein ABMB14_07500 [Myxococcota bacterium]
MLSNLVLVLVLVTAPARAYIYVGNPELSLKVTRPAGDLTASAVHLDAIREHLCGGGTVDIDVDEDLTDLTDGWTTTIPGGDLCGLSFLWGGPLTTAKGSAWTVVYTEPYTSVGIDDAPSASVALTPFTVAAGTFSGAAPRLLVTVD